jgi:Protein of unknown function (DUF1236)
MKRTFLIGVAAGALLAGANIASAQTMERGGAGGGAEQRGGAAAEQRGGGAGGGMEQRGQAQEQMKGTTGQAQQGQRAQDQQGGQQDQRAQDQKGGQQDQRAQDRQDQQGQRAQDRQDQQGQRAQDRQDQQGQRAQDAQRGGGDAKAKLSTEQRTKIRETVIRSSNAPRVTNVNFSISVGTTVPRTVRFAPLPPILVEVYPDWRSYEYFIVQEQIVIVEPGSLRIVAVLDV